METISIAFKGTIELEKVDICLYGSYGDIIERSQINKLSAQQIIDGLKDGVYILNFSESYAGAFNGEETYEYSLSVD